MSDPILRHKRTDACLSSWQIAQVSLGLMPREDLQAAELHLKKCDACAANVQLQQEGIQASKYEAVPEVIKNATPKARPWFDFGKLFVMASAATALALLVVVRFSSEPTLKDASVRIKGVAGIEVAVRRDNRIIFEGLALERLSGKWLPGDALRLRARGAKHAYVLLESKTQEKWQRLFEGQVSADGWLPVGITLTAEKESTLRIAICDNERMLRRSPHQCRVTTYALKASP